MKKIMALTIAAAFAVTACGGSNDDNGGENWELRAEQVWNTASPQLKDQFCYDFYVLSMEQFRSDFRFGWSGVGAGNEEFDDAFWSFYNMLDRNC